MNTPTRVINFSPIVLTPLEIEVLCKGLSFCPTPTHVDFDEFNNDLFEFSRKLRLKYHFRNSMETDPSVVRPPSAFSPKAFVDGELEDIIRKIRLLPVKKQSYKKKKKIYNLSNDEYKALMSLKKRAEDVEIVIKSADKGDMIVIMSPEYYRSLCNNELRKENFYKSLGDKDPSKDVLQLVKNFANKYKTVLTKKEFDYISNKKYRMKYFYLAFPHLDNCGKDQSRRHVYSEIQVWTCTRNGKQFSYSSMDARFGEKCFGKQTLLKQ